MAHTFSYVHRCCLIQNIDILSRNLSSWAANGVLMLNACLTVEEAKAGSHANKGWETFTSKVVEVVDQYGGANLGSESTGIGRGVVFLAWGRFAAERVSKLNKVSIKSSHQCFKSMLNNTFPLGVCMVTVEASCIEKCCE